MASGEYPILHRLHSASAIRQLPGSRPPHSPKPSESRPSGYYLGNPSRAIHKYPFCPVNPDSIDPQLARLSQLQHNCIELPGQMGFENQRIAIIGGGLGGMSFINAALYAGLENVQLYEQSAQFGEVGAGVNITANANRILDAYGMKESMTRRSSPKLPCYMEYHNYRTGEYLGHIDEFSHPPARLLHRAHLLDSLKERIPDSKLNLGKRLSRIDRAGEAYMLYFEDGSSAEADIVIGCDGIKSAVRQDMGLTDSPIYSGQVVYRGFVDYKDLPTETGELLRKTVNFRGPKRHVLILPIGNKETETDRAAIIGFMSEPVESWDSESWLSTSPIDNLEAHVGDWCPQVRDILAGLRKGSPDGKMLKQALYSREPLDKWYEMKHGRGDSGIILLGDSAHSTLPHQGWFSLSI